VKRIRTITDKHRTMTMTQSSNTSYPSSMYIVRKDQAFQEGVRQALVLLTTEYGNPDYKQYYLVSETSRLEYFMPETVIFECDMNGKVKDYQKKVGGFKSLTLEDVLSDFESFLNKQ